MDIGSNTKRSRKYLGLQVLRITAALMVLITHSGYYVSERLSKGFHYWKNGASGVDIFFVLSGFVMIYSSSKLFGDPDGWKMFAERRIIRIVPLYWIATTVKVAILVLAGGFVLHARLGVFELVASYLFLPSRDSEGMISPLLGVGWTLNCEMLFYFIFTTALLLRTNVFRFVGVTLGALAIAAFFRRPEWPAISFYLNVCVLEFLYGMLIARVCMRGRHLAVWCALPGIIVGFLLLIFPFQPLLWAHGIAHGIAAGLIIYSMASLEDHLTRIPKLVLYLADASYAIYLFHSIVAPGIPTVLAKLDIIHPLLSIAIEATVSLIAGSLIHSFVEGPVTRWCRYHMLFEGRKVVHLPPTTS